MAIKYSTSSDDGYVEKRPAKSQRRKKLTRRLSGAVALAFALLSAGLLAQAFAPDGETASDSRTRESLIIEGKQLYDTSCISCHGMNLQGIKDRGPSLIGVGEGAVYFQVHSGRMPMARNEAQAKRKTPRFNEAQTLALAAYVDSLGSGPGIVRNADGSIAQGELRGASGEETPADVARGSELFRLNCSSCHNFTGRGGALSGGKFAPPLAPANEQEIYQAMATGPQNMPKFSDRQLSPEEKRDIIAFVKYQKDTASPGGYALGGFGPATEGLLMWTVGIGAVVAATLWIGARS